MIQIKPVHELTDIQLAVLWTGFYGQRNPAREHHPREAVDEKNWRMQALEIIALPNTLLVNEISFLSPIKITDQQALDVCLELEKFGWCRVEAPRERGKTTDEQTLQEVRRDLAEQFKVPPERIHIHDTNSAAACDPVKMRLIHFRSMMTHREATGVTKAEFSAKEAEAPIPAQCEKTDKGVSVQLGSVLTIPELPNLIITILPEEKP